MFAQMLYSLDRALPLAAIPCVDDRAFVTSRRRQPQLSVRPRRRLLALTAVVTPQSHRQAHFVRPFSRMGGPTTSNRPYRWPVRSWS